MIAQGEVARGTSYIEDPDGYIICFGGRRSAGTLST